MPKALPPVMIGSRSRHDSVSSQTQSMSSRRRVTTSDSNNSFGMPAWDSRHTVVKSSGRRRKKSIVLEDKPLREQLIKSEPHAFSFNCACGACKFAERKSPELMLNMAPNISDVPFKIGDRVVLQHNRTGVVKWFGALETGYLDTDVYVGIQLDDPIGEHDGMFRKKRYFECKPNHGTICLLEDVLYYMPRNTLRYRPVARQQDLVPEPAIRTQPSRRAKAAANKPKNGKKLSAIEQKLLRAHELGMEEQRQLYEEEQRQRRIQEQQTQRERDNHEPLGYDAELY